MNLAAIGLCAIAYFVVSFPFSGSGDNALSVTVFDAVRGGTSFLGVLDGEGIDTAVEIFNQIFTVFTALAIAFAVCGGIAVIGNLFCVVFIGAPWVRIITSVASGLAITCATVPTVTMLVMCFVTSKVSTGEIPVGSVAACIAILVAAILFMSVASYIDNRIRRANRVQTASGAAFGVSSRVRLAVSLTITVFVVAALVFTLAKI